MERKRTGWLKKLGICFLMLSLLLFPGTPIVAFADDERPAAAAPGGVGAPTDDERPAAAAPGGVGAPTDEAGAAGGVAGPGVASETSTVKKIGIGAGIAGVIALIALGFGGGGGGGSNANQPQSHGD